MIASDCARRALRPFLPGASEDFLDGNSDTYLSVLQPHTAGHSPFSGPPVQPKKGFRNSPLVCFWN